MERNIVHYSPTVPENAVLEELQAQIALLRDQIALLTGQAPAEGS